jgi:hypothetical protein
MAVVKTALQDANSCVGDCGISDSTSADSVRMITTAVAHQGIFEYPFAEEWAEAGLVS